MRISTLEAIIIIVMCIAGTVLPRFLPFLLFPPGKPTPRSVVYLGKVLPFAITTMILVYCLKDVNIAQPPNGLPELIGIVFVGAIYLLFKNTLAAVAGGTVIYMLLVQLVFI